MTTLLVVGLILLVVGIAKTTRELTQQAAMKMGDVPVQVLPGETLINLTADEGRLYLGIRDAEGEQFIMVLDAATGAPIGRLLLEVKPSDAKLLEGKP